MFEDKTKFTAKLAQRQEFRGVSEAGHSLNSSNLNSPAREPVAFRSNDRTDLGAPWRSSRTTIGALTGVEIQEIGVEKIGRKQDDTDPTHGLEYTRRWSIKKTHDGNAGHHYRGNRG